MNIITNFIFAIALIATPSVTDGIPANTAPEVTATTITLNISNGVSGQGGNTPIFSETI